MDNKPALQIALDLVTAMPRAINVELHPHLFLRLAQVAQIHVVLAGAFPTNPPVPVLVADQHQVVLAVVLLLALSAAVTERAHAKSLCLIFAIIRCPARLNSSIDGRATMPSAMKSPHSDT